MVLIVKDAKRSIVCVEMEWAQKLDRFQLGWSSVLGPKNHVKFDSQTTEFIISQSLCSWKRVFALLIAKSGKFIQANR